MISTPSSQQDSRHSISFLLSGSESSSIQEAEPTRSTSSLSWASTTTATEDALYPFLSSPSTTIQPRSPLACDVSSFALPRSYSSLSPSQDHIKGKARAVLTPLLIGSNGSNSPCHPCLPDSILRSREPWWATQPKNTLDVTYVNYKSVLQEYGNYVLQRIEFVPTKPDARVPGINILKILQADDVIVDGDKAVNIDSDVVQLQYKDRQEKVQLRCHHTSITTHGLAYLMSTHIYQHLEAESDSWNDGHYIGNVAIAHLVSIFSVQPDIWVPEIAFVL